MAGIVTDPELLRMFAQLGIDKDYVEFWHDYAPRSLGKEYSPYAKFYRDLKSGKRFMVVSGLPKVNADGVKIGGDAHNSPIVGWEQTSPEVFISKPNLFTATVNATEIEVKCDNDQPDGRKKDDKVTWNPQLFLDDVEQTCGEATLLETDPTNQFYHDNVLEWDYGICKRRVRIIEGRIRERWIFTSNPNGEVRIKHNQSGDYKLRLGEYAINDDEELVLAEVFSKAKYPFEVGGSATYYPDAHEETSSVDGLLVDTGNDLLWADLRAEPGSWYSDTVASGNIPGFAATAAHADYWERLYRAIYLFDTSGLPEDATVTAATFTLYGNDKSDGLSVTPNINVYKSTPFANTALQNDDFVDIGAVALCDTPITYDGWNTGAPGDPNDFVLTDVDTDDFGYIPLDGVTKLGVRNANYDVANNAPNWTGGATAYLYGYFAERGTGFKPKLVVTYKVPPEAKPTFRLDSKPRTRARFYPSLKLGG